MGTAIAPVSSSTGMEWISCVMVLISFLFFSLMKRLFRQVLSELQAANCKLQAIAWQIVVCWLSRRRESRVRIALKQKNSPVSQVSSLYGVKTLKQTVTDLSAPVCTGMDVAPCPPGGGGWLLRLHRANSLCLS